MKDDPKVIPAEMNGFSEFSMKLEKAEPVEAVVVNNETMHILGVTVVLEKHKDGKRARLRLVIKEMCENVNT